MNHYRDGKWDFIYRTGKMEEIGGYIFHVGTESNNIQSVGRLDVRVEEDANTR